MRALLLAGVMAYGWAGAAEASVIVTFTEVGGNVVVSGSGSFDTSLFTGYFSNGFGSQSYVDAQADDLIVGRPFLVDSEMYVVSPNTRFPLSFGTGNVFGASSGTGNLIGILAGGDDTEAGILLPNYYRSNSLLSSSSTYADSSFSSLGLTVGSYVYSFGSQSFTIDVGVPVTASVPEPTAIALLALPTGVAGLIAMGRRRVG